MKLTSHIIQGAILSPAIYYLTDFKTSIIFTTSFILIDIDHYIHYIYRCRSFSVKGMFDFHDEIWTKKKGNIFGLSIFHTIEFLILLFILGFWHSEFWIIGAGFFTHLLFDIVYLFRHNVLFSRAFSYIEYFIRKRHYSKDMIY